MSDYATAYKRFQFEWDQWQQADADYREYAGSPHRGVGVGHLPVLKERVTAARAKAELALADLYAAGYRPAKLKVEP